MPFSFLQSDHCTKAFQTLSLPIIHIFNVIKWLVLKTASFKNALPLYVNVNFNWKHSKLITPLLQELQLENVTTVETALIFDLWMMKNFCKCRAVTVLVGLEKYHQSSFVRMFFWNECWKWWNTLSMYMETKSWNFKNLYMTYHNFEGTIVWKSTSLSACRCTITFVFLLNLWREVSPFDLNNRRDTCMQCQCSRLLSGRHQLQKKPCALLADVLMLHDAVARWYFHSLPKNSSSRNNTSN